MQIKALKRLSRVAAQKFTITDITSEDLFLILTYAKDALERDRVAGQKALEAGNLINMTQATAVPQLLRVVDGLLEYIDDPENFRDKRVV